MADKEAYVVQPVNIIFKINAALRFMFSVGCGFGLHEFAVPLPTRQ
jgi:hypothetical protein